MAFELKKDLPIVNVQFENSGTKAVITCLDEARQEIRQINFNKQNYDTATGKFVNDPEKAQKVEGWCQELFGCPFDELQSIVGRKVDVYCYDNFNSFFKVAETSKFTEDMVGQIYQTEIKEITADNIGIHIKFDIDDETYESKMRYSEYFEPTKTWMVDPIKKRNVMAKFKKKFLVDFEDKDTLIGHPIIVEGKSAFGTNYYAEIKPFPQKKK